MSATNLVIEAVQTRVHVFTGALAVSESPPAVYQRSRAEEKRRWRTWYDGYLTTDAWRRRREKVLERAGGVCEGCGERRAVQVHHRTYAHVGDEFLFELVALCTPCHKRLHGKTA